MKKYLFLLFLAGISLLQGCKKDPYLTVSPGSISFKQEGGSQSISISANYPWTATVSGKGLILSSSSGSKDGTITVTAAPSTSSEQTTRNVTIKSEGLVFNVEVSQEAKSTIIASGSDTSSIPSEGGNFTVDIQYNTDFDVNVESSAQSWISFVQTKSMSAGKLEFKISKNDTSKDRTGKVTVTDRSGKADALTLTFIQDGINPFDTIGPVLWDIYNSTGGPNWTGGENWGTDVPYDQWEGVDFNYDTDELGLWIRSFGLQGELPSSIGNLTNLINLWIEDEPGLKGTLPSSFKKLTKLYNLEIVKTSMTSLPDVFQDMNSLWQAVIMLNEKMTGLLPESLGIHESLESFVITHNAFTGTVPESWGSLAERLPYRFEVNWNHLSGTIPSSFLTGKYVGAKLHAILMQDSGFGYDITNIEVPGFYPYGYIEDFDGKTFTFDDVIKDNKYTVYLSWAPWCPFSKQLLPILKQYYEKYRQDGLEIIATVMTGEDTYAWQDPETQEKTIREKGYDMWYNFYFYPHSGMMYPSAVPNAEVYDSNGNTLFSSFWKITDPVRQRFGKAASVDLMDFLENLMGPLETEEPYTSTDYSKDGQVLTLQQASVGKGINVVFMGDGYTDKDMKKGGLYETVMKDAMEEFFAIEPYKTFRDRFNVYAVKVVSPNGRIGEGYTTGLSTTFGNGSEVSGDIDKCYEYALKVPGISSKKNLLVNVMVNTLRHSGIAVMSSSLQSSVTFTSTYGNDRTSFGSTLRHEAGGHGFAFLADEYFTYQASVPQSVIDEYGEAYQKWGWFSNVDFTSDKSKIKWSKFLSNSKYTDEVGIYEGGALYTKGVYRPSKNSMMNENVEYYNAPSRLAIYKRIMELSGEDYTWDNFLEYDSVNLGKSKSASSAARKETPYQKYGPTAPPKIVP